MNATLLLSMTTLAIASVGVPLARVLANMPPYSRDVAAATQPASAIVVESTCKWRSAQMLPTPDLALKAPVHSSTQSCDDDLKQTRLRFDHDGYPVQWANGVELTWEKQPANRYAFTYRTPVGGQVYSGMVLNHTADEFLFKGVDTDLNGQVMLEIRRNRGRIVMAKLVYLGARSGASEFWE